MQGGRLINVQDSSEANLELNTEAKTEKLSTDIKTIQAECV